VDTDVVSYLFKHDCRAEVYRPHLTGRLLVASFMTVAELDRWALERDWGEARRARMEQHLRNFVVYPFNRSLCLRWAEAADSARRHGRPIGVADAWIAATALEHDLPLVTNIKETASPKQRNLTETDRSVTWPFEISRAASIEGMEARYLTDESGERIGVVLDIAEYERLRRSAEEAARTERHPGIAFRGAEGSRRAWVPGTALDVWEIVAAYGEMGRERVLEESSVSGDRLDAALAYYKAHPDEIDQKIEENDRPPEYWRELYPNLNIHSMEY